MSNNPLYTRGDSLASENGSVMGPEANTEEHKLPLSPAHLKMLRDESAISEAIIRKRGYRTADSSELHQYKFGQVQCRLGLGLFIPTYDVCGKPHGGQFRADKPRQSRDGRLIKYEIPKDSTMFLDVLPQHAKRLRDPEVRLLITEGVKKADSLSSQGEVVIGLFGVWNWRGRNEYGGVTSLAATAHKKKWPRPQTGTL